MLLGRFLKRDSYHICILEVIFFLCVVEGGVGGIGDAYLNGKGMGGGGYKIIIINYR